VKVENVLAAFGVAELADMRDPSGRIVVTCEFCTSRYSFSLDELKQAGG
jgi:molecular chaperone Hsp33